MRRFCPYCLNEMEATTSGFKCTKCHRSFIPYVHAGSYFEELLDVTYTYVIPVPYKRA